MRSSASRPFSFVAGVVLVAATSHPASSSPGAPACAVPGFAAGVRLPTPVETIWAGLVGVGDVDGDGAPDVVLAASRESRLLVFRNGPRGAFASVETLEAGSQYFAAALADVDSDGRTDLVVVRARGNDLSSPGSLEVRLSEGPRFGPPLASDGEVAPVGAPPLAADVNEDGRVDLLLPAPAPGLAANPVPSWLAGLGDGRFGPPRPIPAAVGLVVQAVADFDGDGHVDLVASEYAFTSSRLRVLPGDGTGGFEAGPVVSTGLPVNSVVVSDLDRNGRPDLFLSRSDRFQGLFEVLLADGTGTFRLTFSSDAAASSVAAGDVDRDGIPDLLVSSSAPPESISAYFGDGAGGFPRRSRVAPEGGRIALADFDVDGAPDLLRVIGTPPDPAFVHRNACTSGLASRTLLVPVVASLPGAGGSVYRTRLTMSNRSSAAADVQIVFTPAEGSGGEGRTPLPGESQASHDVESLLAELGVPAPEPGRLLGTLRLTASSLVDPVDFAAEAWVSVTRPGASAPSAGVSFPAIPVDAAFDGAVLLGGLREDGRDRTNLGLVNVGGPDEDDVVLRVTLFPGDPALGAPVVLPDVRLAPGRVRQLDRVLALAGLASPHAFARVERVSGTSRFFAYAVVNDEGSSDGSFLAAAPAGRGRFQRRLVIPSVVEAGAYSTDLHLANASTVSKEVRLEWSVSGLASPAGSVSLTFSIPPATQLLLDDLVGRFRVAEPAAVPPPGASLAGALFVSVAKGDVEGLLVGSRVTARAVEAPGRFGVFLAAAHEERLATGSVFLPVSQPACVARTNLALVNAGEAGSGPSVFRVDVHDGAARVPLHTETGLVVPERGFLQLSPLVPPCAADDLELLVTVTRTSGAAPFLAYAIVNDGARPGEGTGDGAVIGMRPVPTP